MPREMGQLTHERVDELERQVLMLSGQVLGLAELVARNTNELSACLETVTSAMSALIRRIEALEQQRKWSVTGMVN